MVYSDSLIFWGQSSKDVKVGSYMINIYITNTTGHMAVVENLKKPVIIEVTELNQTDSTGARRKRRDINQGCNTVCYNSNLKYPNVLLKKNTDFMKFHVSLNAHLPSSARMLGLKVPWAVTGDITLILCFKHLIEIHCCPYGYKLMTHAS